MVTKLPPVAAPVVKAAEPQRPAAPTATAPEAAAAKTEGWKAGTGNAAKSGAPPLSEADAQRFKKAAEDAKRSQAEALARQGGLTVRAGVNGTVGALNQTFDATVGAAVNGAVNLANRALGTNIPNLPSTAQSLAATVDRHLPKPETATERVVQQVATAMAGAGVVGTLATAASTSAAVGNSTVRALATELGANHAATVAGSAGSSGASSLVKEAGGGPVAQAVASVVGGLAPGVISNGVRQARAAATATRTAAENAATARNVVKDLEAEFTWPNSKQDPAVLKPLLESFEKLKASGHVFSKTEERLAKEIARHVAGARGPVSYGAGTFDSI